MSSWVRYCVTVYVGLLFSGAIARPPWTKQVPDVDALPAQIDAESARVHPQPIPGPVLRDSSDTLDG